MATVVTWNGTNYSIPAAGELNWSSLSNFLVALGGNAAVAGAATTYGSRIVLLNTSPSNVVGALDTILEVKLTTPGVSTISLPTIVGNAGRILVIVDGTGDASTNAITIDPSGAELINGASTHTMNVNRSAIIIGCDRDPSAPANGLGWNIIASYEGVLIPNSRTTAASTNTASAIVARDGSGNFTAGTITANLTGNASGSAATITGNLTGDVTSSGMATTIVAGIITNAMVNASAGIVDTKLATISTALKVANSATTAASVNTASAIVARDGSGNFAAGTVTAALTGNATTATTAANLSGSNLTGDVTNVANAMTIPAGTITNAMVNASAAIADTKLGTISTALKVSNSATTAASANTASAIVARDGSGNFSAGTITAALTGNASTATSATSITGNLTGNVTSSGMATTIASGVITNAMVNASAGIVDSKLATISTALKVSNSATTATDMNTASAIVARDALGAFQAGNIVVPSAFIQGPITLSQITTPTAPGATLTKVYAKTDGKIYRQTSDGEFGIGSGSGSGINYLTDWNDGTKAVGTVSTVAAGGNVTVSGTFPNVLSAWYGDVTSGAASIAASTTNALRGTTNYLTALSSASTSGATFVQTPVFNIDGTDLGKVLAVQFDVSGNTTADDWDVVAVKYDSAGVFGTLIPIAGIASTTTGTASAQVPTGTTTFKGFFITGSTASDVYSIRWRRRAGAVQIRLDNLIVGPNSVMMGTAITDWQTITLDASYLVNGAGITLAATRNKLRWRQVGNSMEVQGVLGFSNAAAGSSASAFGIKIPNFSSLTIASNLGDLDDIYGMGRTEAFTLSNTATNAMEVRRLDSTSIQFCLTKYPSGSQYFIKGTDVRDLGGFVYFVMFNALIPITGWSSNVTMADRAVEEYAWNSNTTTSLGNAGSDTSSFGNGPVGIAIASFTTSGTGAPCVRRVRFQSAVQQTDFIQLQLYINGSWISWTDFYSMLAVNSAGTVRYGVVVTPVSGSTTDVDVMFYGGGPQGAADTAWSDAVARAARWRVRKVSGGAAVGFPVGARNVIGDTTGTAVPAGYIGELLSQSRLKSAAVSLTTATPANVTATSLTLTPGVWLLSGTVGFRTAATTSVTALFGAISTSSATIPASDTTAVPSSTGQIQLAQERAASVFGSGDNNVILPPNVVVVTTSTPYFLVAQASFTVSTMTAYGFISAVRVA